MLRTLLIFILFLVDADASSFWSRWATSAGAEEDGPRLSRARRSTQVAHARPLAIPDPPSLSLNVTLTEKLTMLDDGRVSSDFVTRLSQEQASQQGLVAPQPDGQARFFWTALGSTTALLLVGEVLQNGSISSLMAELKSAGQTALAVGYVPWLLALLVWPRKFLLEGSFLYLAIKPSTLVWIGEHLVPQTLPVLQKMLAAEFWSYFWKAIGAQVGVYFSHESVHRVESSGWRWLDRCYAILTGVIARQTQKLFMTTLQKQMEVSGSALWELAAKSIGAYMETFAVDKSGVVDDEIEVVDAE